MRIVVEVDNEENTFVLETGTELSGKSYIKFDRQAIYQTDAVVEKKDGTVEEPSVTEESEAAVAPVEEPAAPETEEKVEAPASEEEKPELVKPKKKGKKEEEEKQVKF